MPLPVRKLMRPIQFFLWSVLFQEPRAQTPRQVLEFLQSYRGGSVQLFSDATCFSGISSKVSTSGATQTISTNILPAGAIKVYAKIWNGQGDALFCSRSFASFTVLLNAPSISSQSGAEGVDTTPSFQVSPTISGGKAQLFSDAACSQTLSSQVSTSTAATTVSTNTLSSSGTVKVWAKVWDAKNNASLCSTTFASYKVLVSAPSVISVFDPNVSTATPTIKVSGLKAGGKAQLFSDSKCTTPLSAQTPTTVTIQDIVTNPLTIDTPYTIYAKFWNSQNYASTCSTVYASYTYEKIAMGTGVLSQVSSGFWHTCALLSSGGVKCWGHGNDGALGDGLTYSEPYGTNYPVNVIFDKDSTNTLINIVQISAGQYYTCALTVSGGVKCWGEGSSGQLGDGKDIGSDEEGWYETNYPVDVISGKDSIMLLFQISFKLVREIGTPALLLLLATSNVGVMEAMEDWEMGQILTQTTPSMLFLAKIIPCLFLT